MKRDIRILYFNFKLQINSFGFLLKNFFREEITGSQERLFLKKEGGEKESYSNKIGSLKPLIS